MIGSFAAHSSCSLQKPCALQRARLVSGCELNPALDVPAREVSGNVAGIEGRTPACTDAVRRGGGLDLELVREVSWSNVRDKLNIGLFDAAG